MIVGFTITYASSAYHHWYCEFESWSGREVQHYVIKFVSDLRQIGGFLRVLRFKRQNRHPNTQIPDHRSLSLFGTGTSLKSGGAYYMPPVLTHNRLQTTGVVCLVMTIIEVEIVLTTISTLYCELWYYICSSWIFMIYLPPNVNQPCNNYITRQPLRVIYFHLYWYLQ
jgi:hypothetical protein